MTTAPTTFQFAPETRIGAPLAAYAAIATGAFAAVARGIDNFLQAWRFAHNCRRVSECWDEGAPPRVFDAIIDRANAETFAR